MSEAAHYQLVLTADQVADLLAALYAATQFDYSTKEDCEVYEALMNEIESQRNEQERGRDE